MSSIVPTVGRRVWYYSGGTAGVQDDKQAFDAGVAFVHNPTCVNLAFVDHNGDSHRVTSVQLRDPSDTDAHSGGSFATWMPYQVSQGKTPAPAPAEPPASAPAASVETMVHPPSTNA